MSAHLDKTFLADKILYQAYQHPKFSHVRFKNYPLCPTCRGEFSHIIREDEWRRVLWCHYCGTSFVASESIAA